MVENRPDATAILGAELVARSRPDGYTIYVADNSFYFNPSIQPRLPYDTLRDFAGVTMLTEAPVVLMTKADFAAGTLQAEEWLPAEMVLAAPVLDTRGRPYAALNIAVSTSDRAPSEMAEKFAPMLMSAAMELSG